jgi:hypothetical protein
MAGSENRRSGMFYVITETGTQADESPFATRKEAETWVKDHGQRGIRYYVLDDAEMAQYDAT